MDKKKERIYGCTDPEVEQLAQLMHDLADENLADFTARFTWFTNTWLTSMQTDIDTARNYPIDASILADQRVLTADLNASMLEGADALDICEGYFKTTFFDNPVKQTVFKKDAVPDYRTKPGYMSYTLRLAHEKANNTSYKTALIAGGYTQTEIDALITLADNIDLKDGAQEVIKVNRHVSTDVRIGFHNVIYDRCKLVNLCADVVYQHDGAKRDLFRLTPPTTPTTTVVTLHVTDNGTATGVPRQGLEIHIPNAPAFVPQTTDANGNVTFTGNSMPESANFHADDSVGGGGPKDWMNTTVLSGETQTIELMYP